MPDYFGSNLDQLGSQRPQGPLLQCLGQCQPSEKIAEVVSQSKYPKELYDWYISLHRIFNPIKIS
jgi:hypothetical protein